MGNFKPSKKKFLRGVNERKFDRDVRPRFKQARGEGESRSRFGERKPQLELSPAVCDKCGKDFELPFMPSGNRPVYCRDCFKKPNDRNEISRNDDSSTNSKQLAQIIDKLDLILQALNRRR